MIPTVIGGKRLSNDDAIAHFRQTGENLGTFRTPDDANAYATNLHNAQATMYDAQGNPKSRLAMDTVNQGRQLALNAPKSWYANSDDSGLVLMAHYRDGAILPLKRADGTPIGFKFSDVPGIIARAPQPTSQAQPQASPF